MTRITVKCIGCGHQQHIGPNEIETGEQPMCEQCFMPMVPVGIDTPDPYKVWDDSVVKIRDIILKRS